MIFCTEQMVYLSILPSGVDTVTLPSCDDCSSEQIMLPSDFPFGGYYHQSAFVSTR